MFGIKEASSVLQANMDVLGNNPFHTTSMNKTRFTASS